MADPEAQVKVAQIRALQRRHQTGGVVFLSSSVLDVGVDPSTFQAASGARVPVYNGSLSGANLPELRWWIDHIVIPTLHPKLAVIGMSSREVNANDPQATSLAKQFFASPAVRQRSGDETVGQRMERYADVSYLFRYRKSIRSPGQVLHQDAPIQTQEKDFTSPQGQELAPAGQSYRSDLDAVFRSTFVNHWEVSPVELATLTAIIGDLAGSGAAVVLVDSPVTQDYVNFHPGRDAGYAGYRQALAAVAARAGVPFFPGGLWDTSLFADPLHLNERGARQYAAQLAGLLMPEVAALSR